MKTQIKHVFLFVFFALLCFTACQNEVTEVNNPSQEEAIVPNSTLANLMSRTTANFGASDNILDSADCFSVELPVTIIVNDITIIIETEADLEQLEDLLDDIEDDEDVLDFLFPITIIFSDYTELIIENIEQLESLISECDTDEDNVIECVDFVYPVSFSVFNSEFTLIEIVTVNDDEALYLFLDNLEEDVLIVSLNYPLTLEYANGETIEVFSNEELAEAIEAAEDDCDDNQEANCDEASIELALKACQWEITAYSSFPEFQEFLLEFNDNYTFDIILNDGQVLSQGNTWSVVVGDEVAFLVLSTDFEDLGGDWQILECEDDRFQFTKNNENMIIEQECEDDIDCSATDISAILQECPWDFSDGTDNYDNFQMVFNTNVELLLPEGLATSAVGGNWSLFATDNNIYITISNLTAFQDNLEGDWLIIECDNDRLELIKGNQILILEKDCEGNTTSVFDCFSDFELLECVNAVGEAEFNLSSDTVGLTNCTESFTATFHVSEADAQANLGAIPNTESYFSVQGQVYLRIQAENGNYQIFTIFLNTENCNLFECFEDKTIEVCDDDGAPFDGLYALDLYSIYDCPEDNVAISFHMFISDAAAATDALISPFANTTNPQSIYARVELVGDPSIFEIFEIEFIVNDCSNNNGCTEQEVDTFLTECIWNAVNYNGSDNLAEYNFDFEVDNQIVVIYTSTITIDATWSTLQTSEGVVITFSNIAGPNIQAITGDWLVVECEADRLELHRGDDILVLEQNCN